MHALLDAQAGVLSRDQLLRSGLSHRVIDRLLADGRLARFERGIYTRGGPLTWLGRAWAGVLIGGDDAVLGGGAAAFLHELDKEGTAGDHGLHPPPAVPPHRVHLRSG